MCLCMVNENQRFGKNFQVLFIGLRIHNFNAMENNLMKTTTIVKKSFFLVVLYDLVVAMCLNYYVSNHIGITMKQQ